jgi:phage gpG-like protein
MTVTGDEALSARFAQAPAALEAALGPAFADIAAALQERIAAKLDGEVVQKRSGRLAASLAVSSDDSSAGAVIDLSQAPYGAALEFGASIPAQLIAAKNAKALSFVAGGQRVFAKHVSRPAFVLQPHSFLRSALAEIEPLAVSRIREALFQVLAP